METLKRTVLLVEAPSVGDSRHSRLASGLREAGLDLLQTNSASEASGLVYVNRRIEAVVINNCEAPMSAVELAARLRTINPRIPIVLAELDPDGSPGTLDSDPGILKTIAKLQNYWQAQPGQRTPDRLKFPEWQDLAMAESRR
jgi:hypothetical protein